MKKGVFISTCFILFLSLNAQAAKYRIVFTEGDRTFNYELDNSDLENKYLAKVQIYKDEVLILDNIRGSTLSDSIFYYQLWHSGVKDRSPTDTDILEVFETWDSQLDGVSLDSSLNSFLQSMNDIIRFYSSVPVIWSGKYRFVIGLHKGGNSVHGQPYVPRLKGTSDIDKPYNAANENLTDDVLSGLNGSWLATINENKVHSMRRVAAGINIHDGRRSRDYRDSEGCLTIHPDDWNKFVDELPNIDDWASSGHTGEVVVKRVTESQPVSPPMPPSSFMVEIMGFFGFGPE